MAPARVIDLGIEHDYKITPAFFAPAIGWPVAEVHSFLGMSPVVFPDGRMVIYALAWSNTRMNALTGGGAFARGGAFDDVEMLVDLHGGAMQFRDVTGFLGARRAGIGETSSSWKACALGDQVLLVRDMKRAMLVPDFGQGEPARLAIANPIPDAPYAYNNTITAAFVVARYLHLVSEDTIVPIPLEHASRPLSLAFLHVDPAQASARWRTWNRTPQPSSGLLKLWQALGGARKETGQVTGDQLPRLAIADFPRPPGPSERFPVFNQALSRNGKVFIHCKGTTIGRGSECCVVAEVGPDGRVVSHLFKEDYTGFNDAKNRGIEGRFTASGRYCILTPIYQSTDPWQGRQRLLDMDSGELIEPRLPRGYSKFRVIDHVGERFWLQLYPWQRDSGRYASCRTN